ncbi:MAG: DUF6477 family protein [Pseudomonadota bacterium]|uniref:DUF6477 family protein n=1 Tax=Roseovarius TaxID=74030 RepID=UPI0022A79847|nr:DUF6477 family protein [Roseovarius sp. EGI FJ00037]MCZ0811040.1 DUF6477 family protein [Roseovarius sp. EGI FJ00037]
MKDILSAMADLRRPRLLISAARFGLPEYRRSTHLPRHLGYGPLPRSGPALIDLMALEAAIERTRKERDAAYRVTLHVDLLIAMMGEARLLRASHAAATTDIFS